MLVGVGVVAQSFAGMVGVAVVELIGAHYAGNVVAAVGRVVTGHGGEAAGDLHQQLGAAAGPVPVSQGAQRFPDALSGWIVPVVGQQPRTCAQIRATTPPPGIEGRAGQIERGQIRHHDIGAGSLQPRPVATPVDADHERKPTRGSGADTGLGFFDHHCLAG